jgi:hypothetical protein
MPEAVPAGDADEAERIAMHDVQSVETEARKFICRRVTVEVRPAVEGDDEPAAGASRGGSLVMADLRATTVLG